MINEKNAEIEKLYNQLAEEKHSKGIIQLELLEVKRELDQLKTPSKGTSKKK